MPKQDEEKLNDAYINTHWQGIPSNYLDYAGFVYEIVNKQTNRKYIGRKYFYKTYKKALVESDWATYTSSSAELNKDIKSLGIDNFEFFVLAVGVDRKEINYLEVTLQIEANVLYATLPSGEYAYYNKNIMSKFFQPNERGTPAYIKRCENISKALRNLYDRSDYVHPMLGKTHPNKGKKLPQTANHCCTVGTAWYTDGTVNVRVAKGKTPPGGFVQGVTAFKKRVNSQQALIKETYIKNPATCIICSKPLDFHKRGNKTCSVKCKNLLYKQQGKIAYEQGKLTKLFSESTRAKAKKNAPLVQPHLQKEVHVYTIDYTYIQSFKSVKEAAEHYQICPTRISKVCNKHQKQTNNLIFSYCEINHET